MLKKTVSVLLAALLVFGLVPLGAMQAFAAEADTQAVADPEEYTALTEGTALTVESDGSEAIYTFTPTESREYKFYSKGSADTVAELRDNAQAYVAGDDDGGSESNFLITAMLDAGKTYYLKVWLYSGTGSFELNVDAVPFAESVSIENGDSYKGYVGTEVQLNAVFSPEDASVEALSWQSGSPEVASVDNSGLVSLLSAGSAVITVTSQKGLTDQITISVIEPGTISVGETKTVNVENPGEKTRFVFTAPESRRYVFYTRGNDEYDRYTEGYIIRGDTILNSNRQNNFRVMSMLQQGQEYILEAGIENWSEYSVGSFDVTIEAVPYATAVTINQGSAVSGYVGYNMYLSTTLTPDEAVDTITWESTNSDVARVNSYGTLSFAAPGTATVTASSEQGVSDSIDVTVMDFETLTTAAPVTSEITYGGGWTMMKFTPSESGDYIFSSSGAESQTYAEFGELDGYETNQLGFTYGYPDNDFMLRGKLTAGTTYYIRTGFDEDDDTGSYQVSVTKAPAATGMTITQGAAFTGYTNNTVELTVTFTPDGASEESVSWESSAPRIVSVDNNGIAELLTEGSAVITATSENGFTATCTITVKAFDDISVGETKDVDIISGGAKAYFKFVPEETATYSFFSSGAGDTYGELLDAEMNDIDSDDESAGNGHFLIRRELTAGSTYYFVAHYCSSYNTGSFTVTLQKNGPATGLAISASEFTGYVGDWTPLTVEFLPAGAIEEEIEWSSSNPRVANVDDNGYVGLISLGTTIITATSENGLTATCTVTVTEYEYETLAPGETKTAVITEDNGNMEFKITPDADAIYVFYSTGEFDTKAALYEGDSSEELASDDDGGENSNFRLQYTLEAGKTYYLKARFWGGSTGSFDVTCDTIPTATSISFEQSEVTGYVGTHDSLELIVEPEGAYTGEITYSCSNEAVVSLTEYSDSVRLDYLSEGTATITATTDTGLTAQCEVAVIDYEALTVGEPKSGSITNGGSYAIYSFVPEETGWYVFTSTADDYFCGYLYDSNGNHIGNQGSSDGSFRVKGELEAGKTYFIRTEFRDDDVTGDFTVLVEPGYAVTELTIIDEPETTTYYEGFDRDDIECDGLYVRLEWSDGETTYWSYNGSNSGLRGEYITFSLNDDVVTVTCDGQTDTFALTVLENPVARIEVTGEFPALIEETGGFWMQRYNDETGDYERVYHYGLYDLYDTEVTIYYKNGTVKTACIGDTVDGYKVDVFDDQYNNPFTLGDDNVVWVTYLGIETEATVTVAESPVAGIEILGDPHPTYIEEADGYWSTRYNPATDAYDIKYFYYTLDGLDDVEVLIHFNDGTSATANVHDKVGDYYVEATSNQGAEPWTIGGENLITVSYLGKTAQLSATIVPNPVASITLPEGTTIELYENVDGYFNENGEGEYFNYNVPELDDIPVTVNYTDGTSVTSNINGKVNGKRVSYETHQYERPWTKGGENFITVNYMGRTAELPVVITDSPVTSIEVVSNPTYVYTYGDDYYGGVNEFYPSDLTGLSFRVHFNDGTIKTYTSADMDRYNGSIDGHIYEIKAVNEQQTVGDNEFTLSYMGKTATFKVKVKQNTVSSVKMTRLPNIAAYSQYYSPDWVGAQITVTNTDNTTKTVTLSRDNLTYRNYMWGNGCTAQVEIDGVYATISRINVWDEDGMEIVRSYFVLSYAGKEYEITGMTYREDKNVVSVEVEDYSATGENMLVTALFEDGTSESVRFSDTCSFGTGFSPDVKMYAAFTEKGMLMYNMILATDIDNDVYVFGQYVDVDGGQGETFLRGDVDGDGKVTIADATLLQRYFAEYAVADRARIVKCGDANCDGKINIRDVTAIQRYLAGYDLNNTNIGKPI